jgi:signal transduction histidine kinase/DNA-binding response OmpR family regulator
MEEQRSAEKGLPRDSRKKVFLVDRSDSFIMYLRILLERMGFRVVPLKKSKLLKELMPIVNPDLVLLGSTVEGDDPVEIVKDVKSSASCAAVPVILIAQKDEDELDFECGKGGFAGCLERPINIFRLFRVVYDSITFCSGEKRVNLRTPFREKVQVTRGGKVAPYRATSLSEGGIFLRTREGIPKGERITITVPLGFGLPETFQGEVIYSKTTLGDVDTAETGAAVRFISPTAEQVSHLTVCILGLLVGDIMEDQEEPVLSLVSQTNSLYEDIVLEHIRLGEELKDFQLQFKTIVDKLPMGMIIFRLEEDGALAPLTSNPAAERLLGGDALRDGEEGALPRSWEENGFLDEFRRVGREGGTFQASNVSSGDGEVDGYFDFLAFQPSPGSVAVTFSDVSQRHRTEEDTLRLQKLESLGFLAGGIAHDFNNLLQLVSGSVDLAQMLLGESKESLPPKRIERMQYLMGQAENGLKRAAGLSDKLLTFARGGDPVITPIDILPVFSEAMEFGLHGSGVKSTVETAEDLHVVQGDGGQLHQVFTNIIMNARQAMPQGGELEVKLENVTVGPGQKRLSEGDYVLVSIRDNGVGIPGKIVNNIFDPYFTTKQAGSGLGLSNALSIVHKHGGWIDVESREGEGTTVLTYLPAATGDSAGSVEASRTGEEAMWTGTGRVLVMDDEAALWPVFEDMLERLGFASLCVRDGDEMLRIYENSLKSESPFDLVILDLNIRGGMAGEEAVARLLKLDPAARAIAASGYADAPVMANFGDYGFRAVLPKPFSTADLSSALRAVLG